jgi:L-lactate dehydrogenase complex protein LldG
MSERDKILGRIKEALSVRAPKRGHAKTMEHPGSRSGASARRWLPAAGTTPEGRLAQFKRNAEDLKATVHLVGESEVENVLRNLETAEQWRRVATHGDRLSELCQRIFRIPCLRTDAGVDARELERCDVGITECDALIAQTGSVLVTSRSAGGRALSALPPHHIVLARRDQLLPDLPEAFAYVKRVYGERYPSFISLITGPSRTGDIERILVLGAHGPKKLTIICG